MSTLNLAKMTEWINRSADLIVEQKSYLTELDSAIGDSDHGENMARGFMAVKELLATSNPADISILLKTVGMKLITTVGGAAGPLYGTFFIEISKKCISKEEITTQEWGECLEAAVAGVLARGKASVNDKTMIDALTPALTALKENISEPIEKALKMSAMAAEEGAKNTIPLIAHKGRASYLGERSVGHQDPGATSVSLILRTLSNIMNS